MSYDIYLKPAPRGPCPTCHRGFDDKGPDLSNPTYNLAPIFDCALAASDSQDRPEGQQWSLRRLSGRMASETLAHIESAIAYLESPEHQAELLALEPRNKWGDLPGAIRVMKELHEAAQAYPDYVWQIH